MPDMSPDDKFAASRHMQAAVGYLGLGMAEEAWNELESIAPQHRALLDVLKIRLEVCRAMAKWDHMAEIAGHLQASEPDDPSHAIDLAHAIRRIHGEKEAVTVLENVRHRFPQEPLLPYNLACYRAVTGNIAEAKLLLAEAFSMDASLRITSLDDPDLVGVWDSFQP